MVFSFEIAFARGIFQNTFQSFIAFTLPNCTLLICNCWKVLRIIFFPFKGVFQKSVACWDHHEMEIWYVITMPLEMETLWELIANSVVMQAKSLYIRHAVSNFLEQKYRFGLVLDQLAILKKKLRPIKSNFWCCFFVFSWAKNFFFQKILLWKWWKKINSWKFNKGF